jgi:hypothetical protein
MAEGEHYAVVVEEIRRKGWRQGSAVSTLPDVNGIPTTVGTGPGGSPCGWILISHDCDIVHHDLDNEPSVEFIAMWPIDAADGNFLHGKNPRRLHMKVGTSAVEFRAAAMVRIPRASLAELSLVPEMGLPKADADDLVNWVARRYVRSAFPDEFNNRLKTCSKDIHKLFGSGGTDIAAAYLLLSTSEELPEGEKYEVDLVLAMREDDFNDTEKRGTANELLGKLTKLFGGCPGISMGEADVKSEGEITLSQLRHLKRLDLDHLSYDEAAAPPSPRP